MHRPVQNTFEGFAVQDPASLLLQEPSLRNRCRAHRSWFSYVPSSSSSCCSMCAAMSASRVWSSHKRAWTCRTERGRERDTIGTDENTRSQPGRTSGPNSKCVRIQSTRVGIFALRSGLTDYAIFKITLYDIIFQ